MQQRAQNLVLAIENRSRHSVDSHTRFHQFGWNAAMWRRDQRERPSAIHRQFQAQISAIGVEGNGANRGLHYHPIAVLGGRGKLFVRRPRGLRHGTFPNHLPVRLDDIGCKIGLGGDPFELDQLSFFGDCIALESTGSTPHR